MLNTVMMLKVPTNFLLCLLLHHRFLRLRKREPAAWWRRRSARKLRVSAEENRLAGIRQHDGWIWRSGSDIVDLHQVSFSLKFVNAFQTA